MTFNLPSQSAAGRATSPPAGQRAALLDSARRLKAAAVAGSLPRPLEGKNIGFVSESDESPEAALFIEAARLIGARVARVRPSVALPTDDQNARQTLHLLGRLYDAIECQGLPAAQVEQIRRHAGVPVFDGLASPGHPSAGLAHALGGSGADMLNRRCVIQAALISAVAGA